MSQNEDKNEPSMSDNEPRVPISELRVTVAKSVQGSLKQNTRVLILKVRFIDVSLGQLSRRDNWISCQDKITDVNSLILVTWSYETTLTGLCVSFQYYTVSQVS